MSPIFYEYDLLIHIMCDFTGQHSPKAEAFATQNMQSKLYEIT